MSPQYFNYRSYNALLSTIQQNAHKFKDYDVIVGVPRSGIIPACALASYLGISFATLDSAINLQIPYSGNRPIEEFRGWTISNILVLDDSVNNGIEAKRVRALLDKLGVKYTLMAVYATENGSKHVDCYLEFLDNPRVFEWNILNHSLGQYACYDLDGVLCEDPSSDQKSTEDAYRKFIFRAKPLYIPNKKIGWIVTSRLEKYRSDTEEWLKSYGIKYNELIMMKHFDEDQRQKYALHGLFKAEIFKNVPALYFVESSKSQSRIIAKISKKPCFCVQNMKMFYYHQNDYENETVDRLTYFPLSTKEPSCLISLTKKILSKIKFFF